MTTTVRASRRYAIGTLPHPLADINRNRNP
jgi:hypothetical protein